MNYTLEEPVLIFGFAVLIFLLFPILMKRLKLPVIIGPIIAGIIVGPNGLQILARDSTIELLGTVGLLFIMFIAGLELDLDGFEKHKNRSILFGFLTFIIPFISGIVLALWMGLGVLSAILFGTIFSSHTLLGYPTISNLGIAKNKAITTVVGGTLLTDSLAMLFLAVITGAKEGNLTISFWLGLFFFTALFAFGVLYLTPKLSKWFFQKSQGNGTLEFNYVMAVLFVAGAISLFVGLEPIIGAFLAGLALNRYIYDHGPLMNRINFTANALFIPFFLLSVGMLMDLRILFSSPKSLLMILLISVVAIGGKMASTWITSKIYGYSGVENKVMFGLSSTHAAATLAITLVGFQLGLFNQEIINAVIIIILVTCILGPFYCEKYGKQLAEILKDSVTNEDLPERILIPVANPQTLESLMELGFIIKKSKKTQEPIYPLAIVQKNLKEASNAVVQAEQTLNKAVDIASSVDVNVKPITRVEHHVGLGIERAATEERITTIIVGWNDEVVNKDRTFGKVIDNLLDHTYQRSLITRIRKPFTSIERVVLIIPNNLIYKPGFKDTLFIVKGMANQLSAKVVGLVVKDDIEKYEKVSKEIQPNTNIDFMSVENWDAVYNFNLNSIKSNNLVIFLSARKGTVAWNPELENIPRQLAESTIDNFIIFYSTEMQEADIRGDREIYT